MRQHSYMSGLSSACPLPLLAQFETWISSMNDALRKRWLLYFKRVD